MRYFLKKLLAFSVIPLIIIISLTIIYIVLDPFKILYSYDDYSHHYLDLNRDYISTETFIKKNPQYYYNSFIFGSSRSVAYNPDTWKKYLPEDASPFSFDAFNENLFGVYHKLIFLDSQNIDIKNSLIFVDPNYTFLGIKKYNDYIYRKHPVLLGNSFCEWFDFHFSSSKAYFTPQFLVMYFEKLYSQTKEKQGEIKSGPTIDPITNWQSRQDLELQIKTDSVRFYQSSYFIKRDSHNTVPIYQLIKTDKQKNMLLSIRNIFRKHRTNYKIIINPMYYQQKLDENDIQVLINIFGKENVYDFSGKNSLTESKGNYYEDSHFRIHVGDGIINFIYQDNK